MKLLSIKKSHQIIIILSLMSHCLIGQEISTVSEIFDYDVGDVFHEYSYATDYAGNGYSSYLDYTILEKYYSINSDTIFYVIDYSKYYINSEGTTYLSFFIDTLMYTNLSSPINGGTIDTVYSDPTLYNGRLINFHEWHTSSEDYYNVKYINGCGGPFKLHRHDAQPFFSWKQENKLIYFLKGDEEWGEPFYVSILESSKSGSHLSVYPNPSSDYIILNVNNKTQKHVAIFSSSGIEVNSLEFWNNQTQINISDLVNGLYFIRVIGENEIYQGKFVKY